MKDSGWAFNCYFLILSSFFMFVFYFLFLLFFVGCSIVSGGDGVRRREHDFVCGCHSTHSSTRWERERVREREREREREWEREREREGVCVCQRERERVSERGRECMRERELVRKREGVTKYWYASYYLTSIFSYLFLQNSLRKTIIPHSSFFEFFFFFFRNGDEQTQSLDFIRKHFFDIFYWLSPQSI